VRRDLLPAPQSVPDFFENAPEIGFRGEAHSSIKCSETAASQETLISSAFLAFQAVPAACLCVALVAKEIQAISMTANK
jgi:hypothetical protein